MEGTLQGQARGQYITISYIYSFTIFVCQGKKQPSTKDEVPASDAAQSGEEDTRAKETQGEKGKGKRVRDSLID
jgi:hypothetical protein